VLGLVGWFQGEWRGFLNKLTQKIEIEMRFSTFFVEMMMIGLPWSFFLLFFILPFLFYSPCPLESRARAWMDVRRSFQCQRRFDLVICSRISGWIKYGFQTWDEGIQGIVTRYKESSVRVIEYKRCVRKVSTETVVGSWQRLRQVIEENETWLILCPPVLDMTIDKTTS
jgi:hypothetical protein